MKNLLIQAYIDWCVAHESYDELNDFIQKHGLDVEEFVTIPAPLKF